MFPRRCALKFQPIRLLGSGGFADVWLARQLELNRNVVVKLLRPEVYAEREQIDRFIAEARIAALLRHPNIVQVLDHEADDQAPWIAYEYVEGHDLRRALEQGPLQMRQALRAVAQVAGALEEAHRAGVLHRDIKPENVLEAGPDTFRVTDFGIARWSGSAARTREGVLLGTPAYMSPEQIRGEALTPATDVYSAGVMLFELLAGRLPFTAVSQVEMLQQHLREAPPRLVSLRPDVPRPVDELVAATLEKNPVERLSSASDLRAHLEALLEELPPDGRRPRKTLSRPAQETRQRMRVEKTAPPQTLRAPAVRPRSRLPVAGLLAALAFAAALGVGVRSSPPPPAPPPRVVPAPPAPPPPVVEGSHRGCRFSRALAHELGPSPTKDQWVKLANARSTDSSVFIAFGDWSLQLPSEELKAEQRFKWAVQHASNPAVKAEALTHLASQFVDSGRGQEALELLGRVERLAKGTFGFHTARAEAMAAVNGDPRMVEHEYLEALRVDPQDARAHRGLALLGDFDRPTPERVNHARKALEQLPRDPALLRMVGKSLAAVPATLPEGLELLERAATSTISQPVVPAEICSIWMKQGRIADAHQRLSDLYAKWPGEWYVGSMLAESCEKLGRVTDALQLYERTARIHFRVPETPDILHAALERHCAPEEALSRLLAVIGPKPVHVSACIALTHAYRRAGRREDSVASLAHALKLDDNSGAAHRLMGEDLLALGHLDPAEKHLRRSIELENTDPFAYCLMGDLLEKRQHFQEAADAYAFALKLDSGAGWIHTSYARMLEQLGRTAEARAQREIAARLGKPK